MFKHLASNTFHHDRSCQGQFCLWMYYGRVDEFSPCKMIWKKVSVRKHMMHHEIRKAYFSKATTCNAATTTNSTDMANAKHFKTSTNCHDIEDHLCGNQYQAKINPDNSPSTPQNEESLSKKPSNNQDATTTSSIHVDNLSLSPFKTFMKRSSMILSKPNIVLNKNVFPTLAPSNKAALKFMTNSPEEQKKVLNVEHQHQQRISTSQSSSELLETAANADSSATLQRTKTTKPTPELDSFLSQCQYDKIRLFKGKSQDEELIRQYLEFIEPYPSIIVLNNKLDNLAKRQKHSQSESIFKELIYYLAVLNVYHLADHGITVLRPNHFTMNIMMMSYMTVGNVNAVQALYDSIQLWTRKQPNYINFITLLTSFCRAGNFQALSKYFEEFVDGKLDFVRNLQQQPNLPSSVFSVVFKSLLDMGELSALESTYEKFIAMQLKPCLYTQNIMINFYRKQKNYSKCLELFEQYQQICEPDRNLIHSIMIVYGEMGEIQQVEKLFAKIGNSTTDFTFTIMTNAYCASGLVVQAEEFFSRVVHRDDKLLFSMMRMYSKLGLLEKLQEMFDLVGKKTVECISLYIDGLAQSGNYSRVEEWVKQIPKHLQNSGTIWSCRLQSAVKSINEFADHEEYLRVVKRIFHDRPKILTPKKHRYANKLLERALSIHLARRSMKFEAEHALKPIEESIDEVYRQFAEEQVQQAKSGSEEAKFQTWTPRKEQLALNKNSIYRPDYVSPYEQFLKNYDARKKLKLTEE
ncbi:hypothetical protein C9374_012045 [Naegleria lovaniensis]|uniref:Uncharacterized protein n=1 Tax=Naegleria lovaniensis TaxID=51637 RepID=A0AA88KI67_NAELO|nr:uncharacterized protein C9374_012045 [Naegleria lovaniensis]KAG2373582.1 hypothetical protein C9374_012045 [Naegleria lovaniensis]